MLTWREEFATGSKLVDLQHRRLIENINKLETSLGKPLPPQAECDRLVSFLEKYVNTHFKLEEICMERYRCPAHAQNQREHTTFLEVVTKFKERYKAEGPKMELMQNLHHLASKWIEHHILTVDIQLKGCIGVHATQPERQPDLDEAKGAGQSEAVGSFVEIN